MREKQKEYITTLLCFFGLHKKGVKENHSKFIDNGGWSFGWVARYGRKCEWCEKVFYSYPFLRSDKRRMISEKLKK